MNEKVITRFSYETGQEEKYIKIEIEEEVFVKKEKFKLTNVYYKRLSDGELFEPFDDPDYNIRNSYNLYRKKHNLLSPQEIVEIRNKYELSVRDFANILGISYSNLSLIENGGFQAKYIDNLLRFSRDIHAFKRFVEDKKKDIDKSVYDKLRIRIEKIAKKREKYTNHFVGYRKNNYFEIVISLNEENRVSSFSNNNVNVKGDKKWKDSLNFTPLVATLSF